MTSPEPSNKNGITLLQLTDMFPNEKSARKWFESIHWPDKQLFCLRCGSENVHRCKHKQMPFRCRDCKKYFSVKTGTAIQASNLPLKIWVWAIYLEITSLKGISSMKLHRDLGITQTTAWFMLQRIREGLIPDMGAFERPVEVDEAYFGGLEKDKRSSKKTYLGRGPVGKTAVVGMKDRATGQIKAQVIERTDRATLKGFIDENAVEGAQLYTDSATAYRSLDRPHETVNHSISEYVNGQAHVNGIESFWAILKRAYHGVYHHISKKHLNRYVAQFAGKHNLRHYNTIDQMAMIVKGMVGKRLKYRNLVA